MSPSSGTSTPKMEAIGSFKMLVNTFDITWYINPEDQYLNLHSHKNLISHTLLGYFLVLQ
jgi:hypothetical protein